MNFLINSFRFTRTAEEQLPVLLGDPCMLTPPPFPHKGVSTPVVYSMAIVPCKESKVARADPSLSFFSGFAIDKDLAVSQRIYVSSADGDASEVKLVMGGRREKFTTVNTAKSGRIVIDSDEDSEGGEPASAVLPEGMAAGMTTRKKTNFGDLYEYAFTQVEEATMTVRSEEAHLEETGKLLEMRIDKGDLGVISLYAPFLSRRFFLVWKTYLENSQIGRVAASMAIWRSPRVRRVHSQPAISRTHGRVPDEIFDIVPFPTRPPLLQTQSTTTRRDNFINNTGVVQNANGPVGPPAPVRVCFRQSPSAARTPVSDDCD